MTTDTDNTAASQEKTVKNNGQRSGKSARPQRVITNPNDVASVVLMQIDAVNAKKDELTIAIKGLTDTAKQLVRVYAEHATAIQKLQGRVKKLEAEEKK